MTNDLFIKKDIILSTRYFIKIFILFYSLSKQQDIFENVLHCTTKLRHTTIFFPGNPLLYASMAVERLGGWQDSCVDDGSRHRPLFRSREEAEEEDVTRLFMGKSSVSQLVGLQVLPL